MSEKNLGIRTLYINRQLIDHLGAWHIQISGKSCCGWTLIGSKMFYRKSLLSAAVWLGLGHQTIWLGLGLQNLKTAVQIGPTWTVPYVALFRSSFISHMGPTYKCYIGCHQIVVLGEMKGKKRWNCVHKYKISSTAASWSGYKPKPYLSLCLPNVGQIGANT